MQTLDLVTDQVSAIRRSGAWTLAAGGDHLLSLPLLRGIQQGGGGLAQGAVAEPQRQGEACKSCHAGRVPRVPLLQL